MSEWSINAALIIFLIVTIGDKILSYLKSRGIDLQIISNQINDLHEWHNHDEQDQPGVKIWWNQKYIAKLIQELSKLQTNQTTLLEIMSKDSAAAMQLQKELVNLIVGISNKQDTILQKIDT